MFQIGDRVRHLTHETYRGTVDQITRGGDVFVHWDCGVYVDYPETWLVKIKEATTMDNPFIETVTTQKIKAGHYNGIDINSASVWIKTARKKSVDLAVCISEPSNIDYCAFNKKGLGNLLKMLQEVHDLMED